jgi:hypothetical protein
MIFLVWMTGGPSHHDTFDPKPEAPADIRDDLKPIDTSVPGIQVTEKFPKFAKLMQHAAILRGMSTDEPEHGRARVFVHTDYKPGAGAPPTRSSARRSRPSWAGPTSHCRISWSPARWRGRPTS